MTTQPWHLYRCVICHRGTLNVDGLTDGEGTAVCNECSMTYVVTHDIIDTLVRPDTAVINELRGLAIERGMNPERWAEVKLQQVDHVLTLDERLALSASEPVEYYQQTTASFEQLSGEMVIREDTRVLEVGVHAPFYFLDRLHALGADCFALNILFFYEEPDLFWHWPHKAIGDMNDLPYQDETFDIVLLSATAHHSSSLRSLFAEVARVLVPGGKALVLNEPVEGVLKHLGSRRHHGRDEHIHEGSYRVWQYSAAMRAAGFAWRSHFPSFFDDKLREGNIHPDTRFAGVARFASRLWQFAPLRSAASSALLWPGQATLGLPLNAVLTKEDKVARSGG